MLRVTEHWTAEKVRRLRGKRTQAEFGRLVGVPKNTVWRWEAGYARPDKKRSQRLSRLAKAERFQPEWSLAGSATLLGDLEEGSQIIARMFGFKPLRRIAKKKD
jgi:transcriptional regulator with XRE-family HTH domain